MRRSTASTTRSDKHSRTASSSCCTKAPPGRVCAAVGARLLSRVGRRGTARHPPLPQTVIRLRRALVWLERLASRPLGAVVLFVLALAVYAVRAIGWPLIGGRDLDEYLYGYIQFFDWHPLLPWSMLFRTPLPGIVDGAALDVAH